MKKTTLHDLEILRAKPTSLTFLGITTTQFFLFVLFAFCLARMIVVSHSKVAHPQALHVLFRGLLLVSFSSYAIYLFFLPILTSFMQLFMGFQLTPLQIDVLQVLIGLPIMVVIAYMLQRGQNEIVRKLRSTLLR